MKRIRIPAVLAGAALLMFVVGMSSVADTADQGDATKSCPCGKKCDACKGRCEGCQEKGFQGKGFQGKGFPGKGKGQGKDAGFLADRDLFHFLLENRARIRRTVKEIPGGVDTLTESEEPKIAAAIRDHVASMYRRVEDGRPIHLRDPLFAEIFRNADKIRMKVEKTDRGVRVRETSEDAYVAKLIRAHAQVVSAFLKNGHAEVMRNHPVPKR